jgi:hypothetical protein
MPVQRFECVTALDGDTGAIDAMSLWAGESVGAVRRLQSAAETVRELTEEAQLRLEQARGFVTIGAG